ncbi:hypothetical protein ACP275_05G016000 [Erythranthe tilingii]
MISKSNEFTRRILHLPAIRPCESVSLSTLLTSLIKLAHSICSFKSKTFFTNKKNATVSINLIETLIVFLEEIRNTNPTTSEPSTFLCLSELHFVFQKVLFLLEDCSRADARLWMLMKSEKASAHFRELMRATAIALDVLDLVGGGDDDEVQELVDLVKKQALRAKFDVGKDDRRAVRTVLRIIDQFEWGIAPQSNDLKRVLGYLGIATWNECNDEVKLLEGETEREYETSQKRDVQFLASLKAFLIFCRCTVFVDTNDNLVVQQQFAGSDQTIATSLKSDDFRCPITLEIMADPVTISTGHTYDRSSISKWFGSGNRTCPITGEKLVCVDLVPNLALKRLIKQFYCRGNGTAVAAHDLTITKSCGVVISSLAAEQATKQLANFLVFMLLSGTSDERNKAAYEIRLLTKTSVFNRSCLVEADAIPPLLSQLISVNPASQENAMAGLLNLSKHSKGKKVIVENGGLARIVDTLNNGLKIEARQHAAGALFYLASVEDYRKKIGRITDTVPGLMGLLRGRTVSGKKNALAAILGLLMHPENHWRVLSAGLVPYLVKNILSEYSVEREDDLVTDSLAVLATLAEKLDGAMAVLSAGVLPVILDIITSASKSRAAGEYCVSLLLSLCVNGGADVVRLLVRNSPLMAALYSLLADGSTRSSKKAGSLIGILHAFNEKSRFSSSSAAAIGQEQFVRVW